MGDQPTRFQRRPSVSSSPYDTSLSFAKLLSVTADNKAPSKSQLDNDEEDLHASSPDLSPRQAKANKFLFDFLSPNPNRKSPTSTPSTSESTNASQRSFSSAYKPRQQSSSDEERTKAWKSKQQQKTRGRRHPFDKVSPEEHNAMLKRLIEQRRAIILAESQSSVEDDGVSMGSYGKSDEDDESGEHSSKSKSTGRPKSILRRSSYSDLSHSCHEFVHGKGLNNIEQSGSGREGDGGGITKEMISMAFAHSMTNVTESPPPPAYKPFSVKSAPSSVTFREVSIATLHKDGSYTPQVRTIQLDSALPQRRRGPRRLTTGATFAEHEELLKRLREKHSNKKEYVSASPMKDKHDESDLQADQNASPTTSSVRVSRRASISSLYPAKRDTAHYDTATDDDNDVHAIPPKPHAVRSVKRRSSTETLCEQYNWDCSDDVSRNAIVSEYTLGDTVSEDDTSAFQAADDTMQSVSSLQQHDFAFVQRSSGDFTYSIVAARFKSPKTGEEVMLFVIDDSGGIKTIGESRWESCIRCCRKKMDAKCQDDDNTVETQPTEGMMQFENLPPPPIERDANEGLDEDASESSSLSSYVVSV
eukprot:scaffold5872_cov202-Alexandrium_tamarense.AAC.7